MVIGINAAAAIKQPRTGVEEYSYQLIKHLTMLPETREHRFFLYVPDVKNNNCHAEFISASHGIPKQVRDDKKEGYFDFSLPPNFEIKILRWPLPFLWTQIRLAWEMWRHKPDVLFIPVHVLPFGSPKNSVAAIHGLEYEYWPQHYPFFHRLFLRWSTKSALSRARRVIAISENTKNDLVKLYGGKAEKISVVHHGVSIYHSGLPPRLARSSGEAGDPESIRPGRTGSRIPPPLKLWRAGKCGMTIVEKPYLLYIGRVETKKNIQGILEAYKILKEKYGLPHQLVLAGVPGYGYEKLKAKSHKLKAIEFGYVDEETKWRLFSDTDIFLFPSFYEGFGIPVLEAQAAGVPVITSYGSCLPEVAGSGALFVNPQNPAQIAEAAKQIIDDKALRDKLIQLGKENAKRFSWEKCAKRTLEVITKI